MPGPQVALELPLVLLEPAQARVSMPWGACWYETPCGEPVVLAAAILHHPTKQQTTGETGQDQNLRPQTNLQIYEQQ